MPAPFTLFEHECSAGFAATPRDLAALTRLHRATGVEVLRAVLVDGRIEVQAAQHVGVVRLPGRTVQVLPKVYRHTPGLDEAGRIREATRNLLVLLSSTGRLPLTVHSLASFLRAELDWFEVLTRLFATQLLREWQRGPVCGYQTIEEDSPILKGRWRIGEQLRRPGREHVLAVAHDEFGADNALNRVFRFVVERLFHRTHDADNRRRLSELGHLLGGVLPCPSISAEDADPARLTRSQRSYEPLLNLARLFLNGGALRLAPGDVTSFAFTFDMNELFEAFVVHSILRHRDELLPPDLSRCELLPQARGAARHLARRDGRALAFRLRPDLVLRDTQGEHPLLIDTKYKRLDATALDLGIRVADFHQVFAYAQGFRCPRGLLLYPRAVGDAPLRARFDLPKGSGRIEVATLDLRRDLTSAAGRQALREELRLLLAGSDGW